MTTRELHREAMELSDYGFMYRRRGKNKVAASFFYKAWQLEVQALNLATKEPTISVLRDSAGWLHLNCEMSRLCKTYRAVGV